MNSLVLLFSKTALCLFCFFLLNACNGSYQNLRAVNRSLGNAQRNVDYANTAKNTPGVNRQQILKNVGNAAMQQSPELQEAAETVRAAKALANSLKTLKQ